jgi:hypothetical protein
MSVLTGGAGLAVILHAARTPVFPAIAIVLSGLALCRGRMIRASLAPCVRYSPGLHKPTC